MGLTTNRSGDRRTWLLPNRIATMLLLVFGMAAAALPVLANMDWTSTAGVLAGVAAACAALVTYLHGWQKDSVKNTEAYQPHAAGGSSAAPPPEAPSARSDPDVEALTNELKALRSQIRIIQGELRRAETDLAHAEQEFATK